MSELSMMVTITTRKHTRKFVDFYTGMDLPVSVTPLGNGTASSEILDYFGLDGSDKSVLFHIITEEFNPYSIFSIADTDVYSISPYPKGSSLEISFRTTI